MITAISSWSALRLRIGRGSLVAAAITLTVIVHSNTQPARAQDAEKEEKPARQWALLIGIEKYHRAPQLRYTVNDVVRFGETLRAYNGVSKQTILEMTDAQTNPRYQPLRASLMSELPGFLEKPGPEDDLIVYFSGHGFRDQEGKLYLAPMDCDPANPAPTGIPVEWFRDQIAGCKAKFKLLLIDACHAGSEKGEGDSAGATAKDLGEPFRDLAGVVTLASSKADEKSQLWDDREHSLFTFWLIQALKGHADSDGDAAVDIDELNKYVHRNVVHTAELRFPRPQTPIRIVRSGTPGVPIVVRLQPQGLPQVLSDMAEQLALDMEEAQQTRVGVAEFTADTQIGELLGADFGLLGRYCAKELERRLMDVGAGKFSVVDHSRLQSELAHKGYSVDDLSKTSTLQTVSRRTGGMPVIALGTISNRRGRDITLRCRLTETNGVDVVGSAGGTARLNLSEWGMLGKNAELRPEDYQAPAFGAKSNKSREDQVVERLDGRAEGPHPLLREGFPFPVQIRVDGKIRPWVARGNDLLVPVRKGEKYVIWVENHLDQTVMLRLLVDGLNTLPQKVETKSFDLKKVDPADRWKFFQRETEKGLVTMEIAPRVNLDRARAWVLDPTEARKWQVQGFATETGVQGKTEQFAVVDTEASVAARKKFREGVGLITFAFYAEAGDTRGVGTGFGGEVHEDLQERKGVAVGNPIAMFHLRYVDADTLPAAGQ